MDTQRAFFQKFQTFGLGRQIGLKTFEGFRVFSAKLSAPILVKYRGPILRVTSQALGSHDSTLDQSATSIQILLRSHDTKAASVGQNGRLSVSCNFFSFRLIMP